MDNEQKKELREEELKKVAGGTIVPTKLACPCCGYYPLMDDTYYGFCFCPAPGCNFKSRNS